VKIDDKNEIISGKKKSDLKLVLLVGCGCGCVRKGTGLQTSRLRMPTSIVW
jgi:hypothetical protein